DGPWRVDGPARWRTRSRPVDAPPIPPPRLPGTRPAPRIGRPLHHPMDSGIADHTMPGPDRPPLPTPRTELRAHRPALGDRPRGAGRPSAPAELGRHVRQDVLQDVRVLLHT